MISVISCAAIDGVAVGSALDVVAAVAKPEIVGRQRLVAVAVHRVTPVIAQGPSRHRSGINVAIEHVIADAGDHEVVAEPAHQRVIAVVIPDRVVSRAAVEVVVSVIRGARAVSFAEQEVIPIVAEEGVTAFVSFEQVNVVTARNPVIPLTAPEI